MIGIKKQTQWYIDKAKALDELRRQLDPEYDYICTIQEKMRQAFYEMAFFGYSLIETPVKPKYFTGLYNIDSVMRTR